MFEPNMMRSSFPLLAVFLASVLFSPNTPALRQSPRRCWPENSSMCAPAMSAAMRTFSSPAIACSRLADTAPAGVPVIDLSAYTVLPGLIDAHGHILSNPTSQNFATHLRTSIPQATLWGVYNLRLWLDHGFTSVRDACEGPADYPQFALRDSVKRGHHPGAADHGRGRVHLGERRPRRWRALPGRSATAARPERGRHGGRHRSRGAPRHQVRRRLDQADGHRRRDGPHLRLSRAGVERGADGRGGGGGASRGQEGDGACRGRGGHQGRGARGRGLDRARHHARRRRRAPDGGASHLAGADALLLPARHGNRPEQGARSGLVRQGAGDHGGAGAGVQAGAGAPHPHRVWRGR